MSDATYNAEDQIEAELEAYDAGIKAGAKAAEARVAELEAELDIARTRWQTLVNAVAGVWNHGLVPGNDEEAVEWAIQQIHEHHIALPFDGGDDE